MKKNSPSDLDPSQVFIVEASAGSGKTYTLAKRYVSLVLDPLLKPEEIPLSSILAITFTNKAAFEMKNRILDLLKKIALDQFSSPEEKQDILKAINADERFLRQKAHLALDYLIRNYNFFQVQTIDSFINALLSGCAFKLNLSASFKIKNDYSDYLSCSLDRLVDKASQDKEIYKLFDEFLRQYLYLENRSGWLPKRDILKTMETLLVYTNTYGGDFKKFNGTSSDLISLKKKIFQELVELNDSLPAGTDKRFQAKLAKLLVEKKGSIDLEEVSTYFDRENFPANKGANASKITLLLWDNIRSTIRQLCETEAFILFNCYIDMFERFFSEFKFAAVKDDVVFLSELNRQARQLFDSQFVTVPELYFRLSGRFSNYLIDEFQDTSFLQWKNIFPLIEDGLSSAGTLFYVGDKKQAIYRFRGGEVLLFDQVKSELTAFRQEESVLSKNYRSREEIVKFNNSLFSTGNLTRAINAINEQRTTSAIVLTPEDISDIVCFYKDSQQTNRPDKSGGLVKVEAISGADEEHNAALTRQRLIETVKDLSQRFDYRDIAILARSNDEVELCASWLLEAGIPVESDKTLNIREQSFIKELVSLLKFLRSPIDNLSFASFITGDIFLKASGLRKEEIGNFLFDLGKTRRQEKNLYYYRKFREEFPEVWENFIAEFFKNVGFIPLYELAVSIISKFRVLQNFPQFQGFFMRLVELISEQEEDHPTINEFLNFFDLARDEELYVDISLANSVRVLTIHKSKGLEFRAVITPNVSLDIDIKNNIVYPEGNFLSLLRLKKEYVKFSPSLEKIYRQEYIKAWIDELNNIYVAFTRARDELYVFVPLKNGNRFNCAQLLFSGLDFQIGKAGNFPQMPNSPAEKSELFNIAPAEFSDWIPLLKDEYIPADTLQNRESLIQGQAMHLVLSFIGDLSDKDIDPIIERALSKAAWEFPQSIKSRDLKTLISGFIMRKNWKQFFFCQGAEVFQEKEFITGRGQTKRIDRLIVKDGLVLIADYKSSPDLKEENILQMREYIALAKEIYLNKAVKGYFLYFDRPDIEEINGEGS
jgi:ATP-dependent helicase/nuclease subunit A